MHIESAERIVLAKLARLRSFMEGRKEQAMVSLFFRISLAFTLTAAFVVCRPTPVVAQGVPDLSRFDDATRESIELACIRQKAQGPVAYGECLRAQLRSIGIQPGEATRVPSTAPRPNMRLKLTAPPSKGRIVFVNSESVRRSLGAVR